MAPTPDTQSVELIDYAKYIDFATQYAKLRWCWDDETMIKEFCVIELGNAKPDSPKKVIDELAYDYGFEDPFEPWGIANQKQKDQCKAVEVQISELFPSAPRSPKP
jgi:hypothetical protein